MLKVSSVLLVICLMIIHIDAQSYRQYQLSLSKAIEDGLAANYNIQIAEYELERAQVNRMHGSYDRFPTIDFNLSQSNRLSRDNSPTSFTDGTYTKNQLSGTISTDWLLFGGHRVRIDQERLRQIEKQRGGMSKIVVENTMVEIIVAYYRTLIEEEKLQLREESLIYGDQKLSKSKLEYIAERKSKFDLNNYQNDLLSDSIKYSQQEKKYNRSMIKLRSLLGYKENNRLKLTDILDYEFQTYEYIDLEEEMLANNTQLQNEHLSIALLDNSYKSKKALRKPSIRFKNSISDELSTSRFSEEARDNGGIFDISASFSVSYNLFDGGKHRHSLQQSKMDRIIADKKIEQSILRAKEELRINLEEYNRLIEIMAMKNNLVKNLTENLAIAEDRLENGYSIFLEYKDAKLDLSKAQFGVLQIMYEIKVAEVKIVKMIGGLLK